MDTDSPFTLRPLRDLEDGSLLADLSLADDTFEGAHPLGLPPPSRGGAARAPFRPQDPSLTESAASYASGGSGASSRSRSGPASPTPVPEPEDGAARDARLRASLAELHKINGVMDSFLGALVAAKGNNEVCLDWAC
jgi:hypothetical protein